MDRLITSALHHYEQSFFVATAARLPESVKANLRQLIHLKEDLASDSDLAETEVNDPSHYLIH